MKKTAISLLLFLIALTAFSQSSAQFNEYSIGLNKLNSGSYQEAETIFSKLLDAVRLEYGETGSYAIIMSSLADTYQYQGYYSKANELYEESYKILENCGALDIKTFFRIKKSLAECDYNNGNYESCYQTCLLLINTLEDQGSVYPSEDDDAYHWCKHEEYCLVYALMIKVTVALGRLHLAEVYSSQAIDCLCSITQNCKVKMLSNAVYYSTQMALMEMSKLALSKGETDSAISYYTEWQKIVNKSQAYSCVFNVEWDFLKNLLMSMKERDTDEIDSIINSYLDLEDKARLEMNGKNVYTPEEYVSDKALSLSCIANIYTEMAEFEDADHYYRESISVFEANNIYNNYYISLLTNYANFLQMSKGDYVNSFDTHWKIIKQILAHEGNSGALLFEKFDEMQSLYEVATSYFSTNYVGESVGPILSYEDYHTIIHHWKDFIYCLMQEYGYEYILSLQRYCEDKFSKQFASKDNYLIERRNYYMYGTTDNPKPVLDYYADAFDKEIRLNILFSLKYEDLSKQLFEHLTIHSDNAISIFTYERLDIANVLASKGDHDAAIELLLPWYFFLGKLYSEHPESDNVISLAEKVSCELAKKAKNKGDKVLAMNFLGIINLFQDDLIIVLPTLNYDIDTVVNELITMVYLWSPPSNPLYNDLDMATKYAEMIETIVEKDIRCANNKSISPIMRSGAYMTLGMLSAAKEEYYSSEIYYRKAINIEEDFGEDFWEVEPHIGLAGALGAQGKYSESNEILYECLNRFHKANGNALQRIYGNLIVNAEHQKDWDSLAKYSQLNLKSIMDNYLSNTKVLTSEGREHYYDNDLSIQHMLYLIGSDADYTSLASGTAYNAAIFSKNLLLRQSQSVDFNIRNSDDQELKNVYSQYKSYQQSGDNARAKQYERVMMRLYSFHPEFFDSLKYVSWNDVQNELSKEDVAIEFLEIQDHNDGVDKYAALILRKDMESPTFVKLCSKHDLDEFVITNQSKNGFSNAYSIYENGRNKLYSMIWSNIEPYLYGAKHIYFAATGILNQLNIEILPENTSNKSRINMRYEIHRLSSTAQLCYAEYKGSFSTATLFGGLNYNAKLINNTTHNAEQYNRFPVDSCGITRGRSLSWPLLNETEEEVNMISTVLNKQGIKTTVVSKDDGSEEVFKKLSCSDCSILHLATHGFYYSNEEYSKLHINENEQRTFISPLKRSGLILSGGNHLWKGETIPQNIEDGTLTAEEIAGMDLSSTQLLVLSACQTALGDLSPEGVYGLQRGFKLAGVQSIIMSLWEVDSRATELMMTSFYKYLFSGCSKHKAFRKAQDVVRKKYRQRNTNYGHTNASEYYWASFILID